MTNTPAANVIADYPAYTIISSDPAKEWQDDEAFAVPFESARYGTLYHFFKLGSVEHFHDGDAEKIERSKALGHEQYFAFGLGATLTAWKQDKVTREALNFGDVIRFKGKAFRLDKAPNQNVRLVEVA